MSQRERITCNQSNLVFHGLDTLVGVLVVIDAIILLTRVNSFVGFFLPIYFAVFGFIIVLFVFYAPTQIAVSLIFYFSFIGRGLAFLFIGSVILTFGDDFSIATGVITIIVAFIYLILAIMTKCCKVGCALPPPITQRNEAVAVAVNKPSNDNNNNNNNNIIINNNDNNDNYKESNQLKQAEPMRPPPPIPPNNNTTNDDGKEEAQYSPIIVANNNGPQLMNDSANDLNKEIMQSFGKDINSISKQQVPGYSSEIPLVLVLLEQALHDTGGYKKRGIFNPETISIQKDDESYIISNNIIAFFDELPSPLLSFVSPNVFNSGVNKDAMWRVLEGIPSEQASVTQFVWDILAKVSKFESNTNMNAEQLARIFGPLMTMTKQNIQNDMLTASKRIVCWRRGIEWRMDKL